jgi:hypothetical protein
LRREITIGRYEGGASGSDMLLEVLDISLMICLKHGCRPEQQSCEEYRIKELGGQNVLAT